MAERFLKTLKLPGIDKPYKIPQTAEDIGAAPAGYGLGEYIGGYTVLEDANTAVLSGWYRVASTTKNYGLPYGIMRVEALSSSRLIQTAITVATAKEYRRSCIDGVWSNWQPLVDAIGAKPIDWMPTAAEVGAAPAGYGLGTYSAYKGITAISEIDSIVTNGKYCITQTIGSPLSLEGVAFNAFNLEVSMINQLWGTQIATMLEGYVLRRRCKNGSWEPWEWENPPLFYGVEYRTTEKHNDKPIYVKCVNYGYIAAGTTTIAHGISSIDDVVGLDIINRTYGYFSNSADVHGSADRTNVSVTSAWAMGSFVYTIKYTKL